MNQPCYVTKNIEKYEKTVLAFVPNFFRLQQSVIDGFEKNNIGIYLFLDKPKDSILLKSKLRINPKFVSRSMSRYLKRTVFSYFQTINHPTYVVVFEGQAFLETHVKLVKDYFKNSELLIYCWDSIERFPYIEHNLPHFDKRVTFSFDNYHKYKFDSFVPLFIPDEFLNEEYKSLPYEYDFCFIGTGHPPKVKFLSQIEYYAKEHSLSFYESLFLPSKPTFYYYKMTSRAFKEKTIKDFVFKGKSAEEIQEYYSKSKVIVDAGNPNESGISLRIFECLALNKKVIMANKSIKNYSFYDPNRFLIFPEEKERILDFINSPYPPLNDADKSDLSTKNWIKKILFD